MTSKRLEASSDRRISRRHFLAGSAAMAAFTSGGAATALFGSSSGRVSAQPGCVSAAPAPIPISPAVESYLAQIRFGDAAARTVAVKQAALIGTEAVLPLGLIAAGTDAAAAKAAVEALKRVVYNAGRPGAPAEAKSAAGQLLQLAGAQHPRRLRGEAIELLSVVGGPDEAGPLAALMNDPAVGEDARQSLQRIPGRAVDEALRSAARAAGSERRAAIELSLRARKLTRAELGVKR